MRSYSKSPSPTVDRLKRSPGFALIATISVMVLLVMIALAMLSLATIELRSSRQSDAMSEARANARLGLMMAIGELQKQVGPDKRVTATGGILGNDVNHRHVAGVWDSWRPDPFSPPSNYDNQKDNNFRSWLVSNRDLDAVRQQDYVINGSSTDSVELLADGTLGANASDDDYLRAGKIGVESGRAGKFAWGILDEGVKARINMDYRKMQDSIAEQSSNLGAPTRTAFEKIEPIFASRISETGKFISLESAGLGVSKNLGKHRHDVTVWSQGPMTNVVDGGLREDLNLMTDGASLPSEFTSARVYSGTSTPHADADPYWQQIFDYASLYKKMTRAGGLPEIEADVPTGYLPVAWDASISNYSVNKTPPRGAVLVPSVAKVQLVFSLVSRLAHDGWLNNITNTTGDNQRKYMLHMVFSPVVTLHNPYNVALKFNRYRLDFRNVPMGFKFYRNEQPQNSVIHSLNNLYVYQDRNPNAQKNFAMTLMSADSSGSGPAPDPNGVIIMQPGEVKVFSAYMPPGHSWDSDRFGDGLLYFDWRNDKTNNIQGIPGWRGEGIGFDIDWLTPRNTWTAYDDQMGVLSLRWTDTVRVDYEPFAAAAAKNRLSISSILYKNGNAYRSGMIEFDYGSTDNLKEILPPPEGATYTHPQPGEPTISCAEIYERGSTPIADYENIKSFAVFSAYAKTTNGGKARGANDEDHMDGRYATKSWVHNNSSSHVSSVDLLNGHGSHYAHELNLEPLPGAADDWVQVGDGDRGNFVTGHTAFKGVKFGTQFELPIAPIQSVANLQNANLASSGYLPRVTYPVANSWAHPLFAAGSVRQAGLDGYVMLDHSYLANDTLFDRFYCSTVANYAGAMFGNSGRSTQEVFEEFLKGDKQLLDQRFVPYLYGNKSTTEAIQQIVGTSSLNQGYKKVAAYQMLQGQWNVNSVSVNAWKAVLAGLHEVDFPVYDTLLNNLQFRNGARNPMSRFRLPNALENESVSDADAEKHARWTGYRELVDDELDRLAREIVKQVQERGPFLSLSEFVNRRLTGSEEQTLAGALEIAISKTSINQEVLQDGREITPDDIVDHQYSNPAAALGSSTSGAPGSVSQGHILNALGNSISVRSNTFTVRAYGESVDANGNVLARAWCEAVVQRVPEYIDTIDEPYVKTDALSSLLNRNFGRRMHVLTFRWLGEDEI